jgi:serine/threonine protein kinase
VAGFFSNTTGRGEESAALANFAARGYTPRGQRTDTTSLARGVRIGVYRVESLLGAGGMGEVYLAHDTRLDRDVALKVTPDLFAVDPDRLARFEREARVLASLTRSRRRTRPGSCIVT